MLAKRCFFPRNKGFTLLELMATLAIVGIVAGFAVPSVRSMINHNQLRSAAEGLRVDLLKLRSDATVLNSPLYLSFQSGANWCYGVTENPAGCDCSVANSCGVTKTDPTGAIYVESRQVTAAGFSNLTLVGANTTAVSPVTLSAMGIASNNGLFEFQLTNDATTLVQIGVNPLGRVKICAAKVSGYAAVGGCP